jgi:hypothetical protein
MVALGGGGGEEVLLLLILNLGSRWGWVVSITPRPRFTPGEKTPGTHCTGGWVGPRAGAADAREKSCASVGHRTPVVQSAVYWLSYRGSWTAVVLNINLLPLHGLAGRTGKKSAATNLKILYELGGLRKVRIVRTDHPPAETQTGCSRIVYISGALRWCQPARSVINSANAHIEKFMGESEGCAAASIRLITVTRSRSLMA